MQPHLSSPKSYLLSQTTLSPPPHSPTSPESPWCNSSHLSLLSAFLTWKRIWQTNNICTVWTFWEGIPFFSLEVGLLYKMHNNCLTSMAVRANFLETKVDKKRDKCCQGTLKLTLKTMMVGFSVNLLQSRIAWLESLNWRTVLLVLFWLGKIVPKCHGRRRILPFVHLASLLPLS